MLDYRHCTLCPRRCGVDRTAGQLGFCRMPDRIRAARAALHYWEEPVISGSFGSGDLEKAVTRADAAQMLSAAKTLMDGEEPEGLFSWLG